MVLISCQQDQSKVKIIPTTIDSLNSISDVEKFIRLKNKDFKDFNLVTIKNFKRNDERDIVFKRLADSLNVTQSFYKSDIDNNGFTDIIIMGDNHNCGDYPCVYSTLALMSFGKDSIRTIDFRKGLSHEFGIPKIISENNRQFLEFYSPIDLYGDDYKKAKRKYNKVALVYKFDAFIEKNENPKQYKIQKIEYETFGCYGSCPIFQLSLNSDYSGKFRAEHFNFEKSFQKGEEGNFSAKIDKTHYNQLVEILNYIDFPNLKNNYSVGWTDDQESKLKITYDNGKTKIISDYGLVGTYGLTRLHELLSELRHNQQWK